jgi:hypothetical protein
MESTAKLSAFVLFILVGATVFGLVFRGVSGDLWVEHLLTSLPGGQLGFLIVVNILFFGLAFFLDFFELAFILVPLVGPVADKLGIDLIWFGVLLGVNMQTSFMHPPFGFALFYLRSVAPAAKYKDVVTGKMMEPVTTGQIYWGAVPFVCIQIIMVALIIAVPDIVSVEKKKVTEDTPLEISAPANDYGGGAPSAPPPALGSKEAGGMEGMAGMAGAASANPYNAPAYGTREVDPKALQFSTEEPKVSIPLDGKAPLGGEPKK